MGESYNLDDLKSVCVRHSRADTVPLTSFHVALARGRHHVVKEILECVLDGDVIHTLTNQPVLLPCGLKEYLVARDEDLRRAKIEVCPGTPPVAKPPCVHLPLALAAFSGDERVVLSLLKYGAIPQQKDGFGNNVLHALVSMAVPQPETAVKMYRFFLSQLGTETMSGLLAVENERAMTPLDAAGDLCVPEMLMAILNTEDIYKYVINDCGVHSHVLYDVTRYEQDVKGGVVHLLHYVTLVTEPELQRIDAIRMLQSQPFAGWVEAKCRSYTSAVTFWILVMSAMMAVYLASLAYSIHTTDLPPRPLNITLAVLAVCSTLVEIHNIYCLRRTMALYWRRLWTGRNPVSLSGVYRVLHVLFSISLAATSILTLLDELSLELYLGLQVCNVVFGFLSLLFFFQLSPTMGHLLTAVEQMVTVTLRFFTMIFLLYMAFSLSLYILHFHPRSTNATLEEDDHEMFGTFSRSMYETLLLGMGLMVPQSIYFRQSESPAASIVLYVSLIVGVTTVLMNLLIALINQRIQQIDSHKESIIAIQGLALVLHVELNLKNKPFLEVVCNRLFGGKPHVRWESNALVRDGRGQVYLSVCEENR